MKKLECERGHLGSNIWLMGSQSIKTSILVLYIVFRCISEFPTPYQLKNNLRKIQSQNFGKIENTQPELHFYLFLYEWVY